MRRRCPSISELNAFHAAARHLSFTRAAQELCVTQGAISRHIAALESYLGTQLFVRTPQRLELTQAGQTYRHGTQEALYQLETATTQLMSYRGSGGVLNLSAPPTFVTHWLFPRLGRLRAELPDVSLNFVRYQHVLNFAASHDFDAAIQFGRGQWSGAIARYLIGRETSIVCSPAYQRAQRLRQPGQLHDCTLLQHLEVPEAWAEWLDEQGQTGMEPAIGPRYNQYDLIIRAAISGFGVAIVPTCLVNDELAQGALVEPFRRRYQSSLGYYLCATPQNSELSAFQMFAGWLEQCTRAPAG